MKITLNEIIGAILECLNEVYAYDPEYSQREQERIAKLNKDVADAWNDLLLKHDGILFPGEDVPEHSMKKFRAQKAMLQRPSKFTFPSFIDPSKIKSERKRKAADERSSDVMKKQRKLARKFNDKNMKTIVTPDGRVIKKRIKNNDKQRPVAESIL